MTPATLEAPPRPLPWKETPDPDPVGPFGGVWVADTGAPSVGTVASPSNLTKTIMVGYLDMMPRTNTTTWNVASGGVVLQPGQTGVSEEFFARVPLPPGVEVTGIRARLHRQTTSDVAQAGLNRRGRTTDGSVTNLATLAHGTTGWATLSDTSLSETVGTDAYIVRVVLNSDSSVTDARLGWVEVTYTMPSYDKGY